MSSVFASLRTATLSMPHGAEGTYSIRGLAPRVLKAAAAVHQRKAMAEFKASRESLDDDALATVDPEALKAYQEEKRKNPLLTYDAEYLIEKGVTTWSLELPHSAENIAELDEDVRDAMALEIVRLSKPSLFQTVADLEAEQYNG